MFEAEFKVRFCVSENESINMNKCPFLIFIFFLFLYCHTWPYLDFPLRGKSGQSQLARYGYEVALLTVRRPASQPSTSHLLTLKEGKIWDVTKFDPT